MNHLIIIEKSVRIFDVEIIIVPCRLVAATKVVVLLKEFALRRLIIYFSAQVYIDLVGDQVLIALIAVLSCFLED